MIEEWLTKDKIKEIENKHVNIVIAELIEEDGNAKVIGCTVGEPAILELLLAESISNLADNNRISFGEVQEHIRIAHAWSAGKKEIDNIIKKHKGGKKDAE